MNAQAAVPDNPSHILPSDLLEKCIGSKIWSMCAWSCVMVVVWVVVCLFRSFRSFHVARMSSLIHA